MEKRILVFDESGKQYEATHPKRAKGLVKKGRARFVDDGAICLMTPPDHDFKEDSRMDNNQIPAEGALTVEYILAKVEAIRANTEYILDAINGVTPDAAVESEAIAKIVHEREETNRVMLDFYLQIYEDLNPKAHAMRILEKAAENPASIPMGEVTNMLKRLLDDDVKK